MAQRSILADQPVALLKQYRHTLVAHGIPVEDVILFGSYATGRAKPWSDVDVCIVSPMFGKNRYDEMVRLKKLAVAIEPMIEPHPYHPRELNNPYDPLAFEIRTHGQPIT